MRSVARPRRRAGLALSLAVLLGSACASSNYEPYNIHPDELVLTQEGSLTLRNRGDVIAQEPEWAGLAERVDCVPEARHHARRARRHGRTAVALAVLGGALGVASLVGLAGTPFVRRDPTKAGALIGTGLGVGLLGVGLAGGARHHRTLANGHAVDAVNYYNDDVLGGRSRCRDTAPAR